MSRSKHDDLPDLSPPEEAQGEPTVIAQDLRLGLRFGHRPWLLVVGGRCSVGMLIEVRGKMVIGRSPPADIILDDEGVSRRHAQIELLSGVVKISDLGSSNGIRVSGRRVQFHALRDGERVRLGDAVITLLHFDDNTPTFLKNLQASVEALVAKNSTT